MLFIVSYGTNFHDFAGHNSFVKIPWFSVPEMHLEEKKLFKRIGNSREIHFFELEVPLQSTNSLTVMTEFDSQKRFQIKQIKEQTNEPNHY